MTSPTRRDETAELSAVWRCAAHATRQQIGPQRGAALDLIRSSDRLANPEATRRTDKGPVTKDGRPETRHVPARRRPRGDRSALQRPTVVFRSAARHQSTLQVAIIARRRQRPITIQSAESATVFRAAERTCCVNYKLLSPPSNWNG